MSFHESLKKKFFSWLFLLRCESSENSPKTFLFVGIICERFGRKVILQWLAFLAFGSWIWLSQAWNFYCVIGIRIVQGFISATLSTASTLKCLKSIFLKEGLRKTNRPLNLHEISLSKLRFY